MYYRGFIISMAHPTEEKTFCVGENLIKCPICPEEKVASCGTISHIGGNVLAINLSVQTQWEIFLCQSRHKKLVIRNFLLE